MPRRVPASAVAGTMPPMQASDDMGALGRLIAAYPSLADPPAAPGAPPARQIALLQLPAGAARFREHDACGGSPMVLRGRGRIARRMQDGRELVLYDLAPGESCVPSTSCLLGDARHNAQAACETEVELAVMPRALFDRLAEHPPFRSAVFSVFGERLVRLVELAEAVGIQRVEQRLAGGAARLRARAADLARETGTAARNREPDAGVLRKPGLGTAATRRDPEHPAAGVARGRGGPCGLCDRHH